MTPTPPITPRPAPRRVLEDASGRRLQRMRWVGRSVALLFLVWLTIVIVGGLGVGPVARLPLGNILRPSTGPPPLPRTLHPRRAAPADLIPALPAAAVSRAAPGTRHGKPAHTTTATSPGRSSVAPGHTKTTTTTTTRGKSGAAPGHTKTTTTTTTTTTAATTTNRAGKSHVIGKKP